MTNQQKLDLVEELLCESDVATSIDMDIARKRKTTKRERTAASLISLIYKIIHPSKKCPHPDWSEDAKKMYKDYSGKIIKAKAFPKTK